MLLIITAVATVGHYDAGLLLSVFEQESADEEGSGRKKDNVETLPNVDPISLSRSDAVIVVESDSFFTPNGSDAMRAVVDELEELDHVAYVLWMDRVPILNIFGLPEPLLPKSTASMTRFQAAKEKAARHPLVGGQLLSDDHQTALLLVSFNFLHLMSDEDATNTLKQTAEKAASQFPDVPLKFRVTGRVPMAIAAIARHEANKVKYQAIGYGMIFIMTVILFRGIRAVIIVAMAPVMGVFWTLGMLEYLDLHRNPLNEVILPVLVSLVGLTDGVHLMVQIRKLRASGLNERDAARTGIQQVGLACFLTSLTTAIGFGSLMLAESETVQEFGQSCVVGVTLVFIAVVTIIPLACSTWLGRKVHLGHENSLIDRNLDKISVVIDAVLKRQKLMSTLGIGLTLVMFMASLTLRPDQRQSNDIPESSEASQAFRHMDQAFGGLEFAEVDISWNENVASDSPDILNVVTAVDDVLRGEELIGHPLSIRNLIDAQPGSGPPAERMTLMELLPPPLKRAFFVPEHRTATVTFRVQDLGIAKYGPVFKTHRRPSGRNQAAISRLRYGIGRPRRLALGEPLSDCHRPCSESWFRVHHYFRCAGDRLSLVPYRPDLHHSQRLPTGAHRNVSGADRLQPRNRDGLQLHDLPGNRGRRHDPLPDTLHRRTQTKRR